MGNLSPLFNNKKPFATGDGSISFYNLQYKEGYHAKSIGAFTESLHKFVIPSEILLKSRVKSEIWLLDIFFGLGYNIAVTIEMLERIGSKTKINIVSIEKDEDLIKLVSSYPLFWPKKGFSILKKLIREKKYENYSLYLLIDDFFRAIQYLCSVEFDIVYFDPFSISKNREMWKKEVYKTLFDILKDDGCVVTYSCRDSVRRDFYQVGFIPYPTAKLPDGFQPGTIFYKRLKVDG